MEILNINNINCPNCKEKTEFLYGKEDNIKNILERYKKSDSYVAVYRNKI
jgi:hypothetical protein